MKLAISSNSDWVVPATHDERRYAVCDIDNCYAQNVASEEKRKEYFGAIARELREGGDQAMLYDLLQMDLGDWHPREVPMTPGLMRQKKQSLKGHFKWLEPMLQSGELPAYYKSPGWILTDVLVAHVKTFRGLEEASDESITGWLKEEMGFSGESYPKGNKFRVAGGGPRGWVFPPLAELRERWETKFGGAWDWIEPEVKEWQPPASPLDLPAKLIK